MTAGLSEDYGPNKLQNHYSILIQALGRMVVIGWDLPGSVGTGQYLWRSVRICWDLLGSVEIGLASHSETFWKLVVGYTVFPILRRLASAKILFRTGRTWTTIDSLAWYIPQDCPVLNTSWLFSEVFKDFDSILSSSTIWEEVCARAKGRNLATGVFEGSNLGIGNAA